MTLHQAGHWELAASHVILLLEEEFTTSSNCHGKQSYKGILDTQFRKKNPTRLIKKPACPFLSYIPVAPIMLIFVLFLHDYDRKIPIILWSTQNNDFHFHFLNFQSHLEFNFIRKIRQHWYKLNKVHVEFETM